MGPEEKDNGTGAEIQEIEYNVYDDDEVEEFINTFKENQQLEVMKLLIRRYDELVTFTQGLWEDEFRFSSESSRKEVISELKRLKSEINGIVVLAVLLNYTAIFDEDRVNQIIDTESGEDE